MREKRGNIAPWVFFLARPPEGAGADNVEMDVCLFASVLFPVEWRPECCITLEKSSVLA